jgi:signal transduction histidine kinase
LEQEKQLVATQAVLDGETIERMRLARDLHDGLGGLLSATQLSLADLKKNVNPTGDNTARFNKTFGMLDQSMREMRRVAHHLMPDSLSRYGLKTALSDFCNTIPSVAFSYYGADNHRFDRNLEVVVYRIAHELINNSLKHADATHILVQIVQEAHRIALTVQDNGTGFDPETVTSGMGLHNIRTRVALLGGTINMRSSTEEGTEIDVEFKIES